MQALRYLFSPAGRLSPQPFIITVLLIYLAGAAAQFLTTPRVIVLGGLWPFFIVQALLLWVWFSVHAKRLRDAGRPIGWAVGAGLLYALSIILLLLIVMAAFIDTEVKDVTDVNATGALALILLISVITALLGSTQHDLAWLLSVTLTVMAFLPIIVMVAVSVWTATRPSVGGTAR